jgi:hypothetical protein
MEIEVGDYLLTKDHRIFRIMDIFSDTSGSYYDIKSLKADYLIGDGVFSDYMYDYEYIRAVPRNKIRHIGKLIKSYKATKTLKILYG